MRNYLIWECVCFPQWVSVCMCSCISFALHCAYAPNKDRNMNHILNQWSLFCLSFRIHSWVGFQLACVSQLILLPDALYFVLAIEKCVYGLNYSNDGSWMKGADSCTQWQDICMRSPLTSVADTLAQGQIFSVKQSLLQLNCTHTGNQHVHFWFYTALYCSPCLYILLFII